MKVRFAAHDDLVPMRKVMTEAIEQLQRGFLTSEQIAASHAIMGLDTQLIADQTYFVVEVESQIVGCGGWSRRATLYGGDHSVEMREPRLLDPLCEAARVRAMYTDPACARRGVGRMLLKASEVAARHEGFKAAELMATMSGEPLYTACGYQALERTETAVAGVHVPLILMRKLL